jgi:hypothetical protein
LVKVQNCQIQNMELSQDTFYFHSGKSFYLFSFSRIYQSNTPQVYKKNLSSVDIKGKILIIFAYFQGLVVMLNKLKLRILTSDTQLLTSGIQLP